MRQPPPLFEEDYALSLRICQSWTSLAPSFVITDGVDCTHRGSRQSFTLGVFAPPADLIASINELEVTGACHFTALQRDFRCHRASSATPHRFRPTSPLRRFRTASGR